MNFLELLESHGIEYRRHGEHHHTTDGWVQVDCPHCSPNSGSFRLGWNEAKGYFSCWQCGGVRTAETLSEILGVDESVVWPLVAGVTVAIPPKWQGRQRGVYKPPEGVGPLTQAHRKYLHTRGVDPDLAESGWGIGAIGRHPTLSWRLFLPVHEGGRPVTWTTRSLNPTAKLRYVSAGPREEEVPIKSMLYGLDHVRLATIVVEGPLDAVRVGPGAVATMGTEYTEDQIDLLRRIPQRVICFDRHPVAQARANKLASQFHGMTGETRVFRLSAGKDPGDCAAWEVEELRRTIR